MFSAHKPGAMLLGQNVCVTAWKCKYICILLWVKILSFKKSKRGHRNRELLFQMHKTQILIQKKPKQFCPWFWECKYLQIIRLFHVYTNVNSHLLWTSTHSSLRYILLSASSLHNYHTVTTKTKLQKEQGAGLLIWLRDFFFFPHIASHTLIL